MAYGAPQRHPDMADDGPRFGAAPPGRHPEDDELREAGLCIWERVCGREPVWRYGDVLIPHGQALAMVRRAKQKAMETTS